MITILVLVLPAARRFYRKGLSWNFRGGELVERSGLDLLHEIFYLLLKAFLGGWKFLDKRFLDFNFNRKWFFRDYII